MKAKFLILSLTVGFMALSTTFQAQAQETSSKPGRKTTFAKGEGHWFIDLQAGAAMLPLGEANNKAAFMDRVGVVPQLAVGKWHEPYFATRLRVYGGNVYGFIKDEKRSEIDRYNNMFGFASLDFMFDLVDYFGHYSPKRVFHFIPVVGVGLSSLFSATDKDGKKIDTGDFSPSPSLNGGLLLKFRLGRRVDLNIEGQAVLLKSNFVGSGLSNNNADLLGLASAGLSIRLGKTDFTEVVPMNEAEIMTLREQINSLRRENAELSKRPVSCPECPEIVPIQETKDVIRIAAENIVYFRLGSAKIDQNQMINIYNTARYAKENNTKIFVVGYADVKTGTSQVNMRLSQKRANAVADVLVKKYGVSRESIVIDYKGSDVQPFATNEWNRVVIMTAE